MTTAHVLIPVKALGLAKSRLAHVLDPGDRAALVLAMLADTLHAALAVEGLAVTVITTDADVAALALGAGAHTLADPPAACTAGASVDPAPVDPASVDPASVDPLNAALAAAAHRVRCREPGVDLIALHADLPALRPAELSAALSAAREAGRAVVVDHTGTGTSALLHCTPGPLVPLFGPDSAHRHVRAGARPLPGDWPGLRLDVDTVADLEAATVQGVGPATASALGRIGWPMPVRHPDFG
ncbi:2-phospho-L-lactate guanylyltransferase [Rhodococcus ruber]|uniref:2-phospho-L-lactate guanylyltransferase n=1 Tax=Rhodococcus TaxID=1827 RepID=UPI000C153655|nr:MULTISPECIES: 2-phospho-L-lactate guanylyltransferase [Rhodococcus]ATQ28297.1 2-phospho-L-lactate guanylyltransferase [Rhodococcus ruber]MCZ1072206.1 2-phospho-L-lactate guanylyltransferase [Rhodococcus sp. A5(2022)]